MSLPELAKSCRFWDCIDLIRELVLFHPNARDTVMTEKKGSNTQNSAIRRNGRLHSEDLSHDVIPDIESQVRKSTSDFSKPALIKKITLNTNQAQQVFEHCYIRVDYSLYVATKVARNQFRVVDAKKAEKILGELFEKFSSELSQTVKEMNKLLESKVPKENQNIVFDHKREFEVPIRTGFSMRLINLTQMLDALIASTEKLEINNVLTLDDSDETIKSWVYRYRQFCKAINRIRLNSSKAPQPSKNLI